jgi:hypothetical protein
MCSLTWCLGAGCGPSRHPLQHVSRRLSRPTCSAWHGISSLTNGWVMASESVRCDVCMVRHVLISSSLIVCAWCGMCSHLRLSLCVRVCVYSKVFLGTDQGMVLRVNAGSAETVELPTPTAKSWFEGEMIVGRNPFNFISSHLIASHLISVQCARHCNDP